MRQPAIYHSIQRYRTLRTNRISALPVLILEPHGACNCRCVMCDIWKGNSKAKQLTEEDVSGLLIALKKLGTRQVVLSGGEALLHANFFRLCAMLKEQGVGLVLLSTGLLLKKHAERLVQHVDSIIVSLDGDGVLHDEIRQVPGAFLLLKEGVQSIKGINPSFRITARTVIHRLNFKNWGKIIEAAREVGLDGISFLPADVSSNAFNRETAWVPERQAEVALRPEDLPLLRSVLDELLVRYRSDMEDGFVAERAEKLEKIYDYYAALHGLNDFPRHRCNAPWVSAVIEPDGAVRPCFFHAPIGNIHQASLPAILNGAKGMQFRKELDMDTNETCRRCVCTLHLSPWTNVK